MATLARAEYRRKVYGCWLGKTVGGTLGQTHEGKMQPLELTFYDPVPTGAIANDDLDLQLIWLAALRAVGPGVDERVLGDWWRQSLVYPFDEYGMALWNLHRGIDPPVSGQFANPFGDCMGSPIRSEIWACIAPGRPDRAAEYAYCDGCVDHSGEGIWGEMFFAALESAAFVISDRERLLDLGLGLIPADCRTAGAIRLTRRLHADGLDWRAARERILDEYGHVNFTDAPQNIAFTVLGWLWGEDAGDAMCKAVNCGYDTDCTGATLGAILGLIHGPEVFDRRWVEPVGDEVVVGWGVVNCETPATLQELSDWTLAIAEQVLDESSPVRLGDTQDIAELELDDPSLEGSLLERLRHHDWSLRCRRDGQPPLWLHLGGPPALEPGEVRTLSLHTGNGAPAAVTAQTPAGWQVDDAGVEGGRRHVRVTAPRDVDQAASHQLVLSVGGEAVPVTFVPACGWQVAGPIAVASAAAALADPPQPGESAPWWTADHRLVLDDGGESDRVYWLRTTLALSAAHEARLVCATPDRQRVWLDGEEVLAKAEPTPFVPAAHRSGPNTATTAGPWAAGEHELRILLAVRAGQRAEVHVFVTRSNQIEGPRLVPWEDVVHRMPRA